MLLFSASLASTSMILLYCCTTFMFVVLGEGFYEYNGPPNSWTNTSMSSTCIQPNMYTQISSFIDEAVEKGDSVLVHSLDGIGRCVACVTAYLMFRHRWSFEKALDFLCNKRPDAAPNPGFVQQVIG